MKSLLIGLLGVTLIGCSAAHAQTGYDAYVGRPIKGLAMRMGPPTAMSRDPNGWPIFEWSNLPAKAIVFHGLLLYRGRCTLEVMTRPARRNPTSAMVDWIMENWRFVGLGCLYE
jgi:hypothetical protein